MHELKASALSSLDHYCIVQVSLTVTYNYIKHVNFM